MTRFALTSPLVIAVAALSLSSVACGAKGSDDDSSAAGMGATGGTGSGGTGGGSGGSAGMAMITKAWTFETTDDSDQWIFEYFSAGTLPDGTMAPAIAGPDVKVEWSTGKGEGDMGGALMVSIPYATAAQYVGVGVSIGGGVDMSGKILKGRIKVDSGLESAADFTSASPGAKLYAKSGTEYAYAAGDYDSITASGSWSTVRFDMTNPAYTDPNNPTFDPTNIKEFGIQIDSGAQTTTAAPAVILIDNVQY